MSLNEGLTKAPRDSEGAPSVWHRMLERPHTLRARKLVFDLHMWCGVAISLYLVLISLTGAALVFRDELEVALTSNFKIEVKNERVGLDPVVESVESTYPGYRVSGVINTIQPDLPLKIYIEQNSKYRSLFVNQYSGQVLGEAKENKILKFLQELHFNLLLNRNGRMANAFGGALLCFMCLSGVVLWWKGLRTWTRGLTINLKSSLTRLNWDLHNAVGFWTFILAVIWGLSGFYFGFRPEFSKAVNVFWPVTAQTKMKVVSKGATSNTPAASIDEMLTKANARLPNQWIARIAIPAPGKGILQIWMTDVGSYKKDDNTEVDIDPSTGEIIAVSSPSQRRSGDLILIWLTRLHFGNFGGTPIKALWVLLGLTPALLAVTGIFMWWHRSLRKQWAEYMIGSG